MYRADRFHSSNIHNKFEFLYNLHSNSYNYACIIFSFSFFNFDDAPRWYHEVFNAGFCLCFFLRLRIFFRFLLFSRLTFLCLFWPYTMVPSVSYFSSFESFENIFRIFFFGYFINVRFSRILEWCD